MSPLSGGAVLLSLFVATTLSCATQPNDPGHTSARHPGAESKPMDRPLIVNNTLVASDKSRLRGGTFWLYGWIPGKTTWALSDAPWKAMQDNHLNLVRVACAYRPERADNYSLDRYEGLLDSIIDRAEKLGVHVIIDYHPRPGTYNMTAARAFWSRFASRYKDRKNVVYELTNEPVFSQPDDYADKNLRDFEELWQLTHKLAPDTPSVIMTFCQVGSTGRTPKQVVGALRGIDWSKTVVGFHSYWQNSSERIVELKQHYPCINTEFYTARRNSRRREMQLMDGYVHHGTLMEKLGISWTHWSILDTEGHLQRLDPVIADLKANGCYWGDEE